MTQEDFFNKIFVFLKNLFYYFLEIIKNIYHFLITPSTLNFLKIFFLFFGFLLFLAILILLREIEFLNKFSQEKKKEITLKKKKREILFQIKKLENNPNKEILRKNIIKAEEILCQVLKEDGFEGEDFSEQLEQAGEIIPNLRDLEKAHSFKEKIEKGEDFDEKKGEIILSIYLQTIRLLANF